MTELKKDKADLGLACGKRYRKKSWEGLPGNRRQTTLNKMLFFINHDLLFSIAPVPVFQSYTLLYLLDNLDQVA